MYLIKNIVNKIWNDTLKMRSSYSISQQQNTPITNETQRDYKEINLPEQDFRTVNNNEFNIQNNTSESLERYNVNDDTEKIKDNNECKIYENGIKYPLLTLEDALVDRTALSLKEFDKILDVYHKHNNISDTIDPISFDDLHLIINNAESNVLNIEEEKNIGLDKHNLRDADILNGNLYNNTNSKADYNIEMLVENITEPEFIDISNITLYKSSNINKIDIDVYEPAILATDTNTILSNSKIESKFEVNKPTKNFKVEDEINNNINSSNAKTLVENKTEPEFINISNITLYNSSNINKIDTDVDEPAIHATANNTILSKSKIESKFEVNKPTTFFKVEDEINNNIHSSNAKTLVENKTEPEFIDICNITLYNSSNISKIDTFVDELAIPAKATNTILSNSKIESKFDVNKPTTFIKVTDNFSSNIESCIDSNHNHAVNVIYKEKIVNESILINSKANTFNIDTNEINNNINSSNVKTLVPNENSQYRGILLEHKDNGENYPKESPNNNLTVIEILSADDEDSNNISKNIDTSDIISTISEEDLKEKSLHQNDSDCSGYHSSDFEFIDEEEAKKFGYYSSNEETKEQSLDDFIINDYFDTLFPNDEQNNDGDTHVIPEGDNFVNLFINQNYIRTDYSVKSKPVTTGMFMNTNFESIGLSRVEYMRYREYRPELEAYRQDAYDSAKRIRLMYPQENNKVRLRRRYRN